MIGEVGAGMEMESRIWSGGFIVTWERDYDT